MMKLIYYCEGRRYIVHGDFHFGNILCQDNKVTGIIDWGNVMYGDFVFDIATIHMQFPKYNMYKLFKDYYKEQGIVVENFEERFVCASLCKGLDALRFSAKLGRRESCEAILRYLENLR